MASGSTAHDVVCRTIHRQLRDVVGPFLSYRTHSQSLTGPNTARIAIVKRLDSKGDYAPSPGADVALRHFDERAVGPYGS